MYGSIFGNDFLYSYMLKGKTLQIKKMGTVLDPGDYIYAMMLPQNFYQNWMLCY